MSGNNNGSKRISIRKLRPGGTVEYAYDGRDRQVTEDVQVKNLLDIQRLESLGVRTVVLADDNGEVSTDNSGQDQEEQAGSAAEGETLTATLLDKELEQEPNLIKKRKKTYEKLVDHFKNTFEMFHRGEANLDTLYELEPYLEKFIDFVEESPASVSLLTQVEDYDSVTYNHSVNVSILSILYGRYRNFPSDKLLELAFGCLIHDIGKTEVPDSIINKSGKLTESEFEIMKKHPAMGYEILDRIGAKEIHKTMALEHHERPDGSGYPGGRSEADRFSRILSVIDVYEAMTSPRSYKSSVVPLRAYRVLKDHFAPFPETRFIVKGLIHCLGVFPAGALVRLTDGCVAIVQRSHPQDLSRPVVSIVADEAGEVLAKPYVVDLGHVYRQKMYSHGHYYGEETAIQSMILPGSDSSIKARLNEVHDGVDSLLVPGFGPVTDTSPTPS